MCKSLQSSKWVSEISRKYLILKFLFEMHYIIWIIPFMTTLEASEGFQQDLQMWALLKKIYVVCLGKPS